jgi:S-adenosylmethionine decarboxylase
MNVEDRMENTGRVGVAALPGTQHGSRDNGRAGSAVRINPRAALHAVTNHAADAADHFVERDGLRFAGTHLIVDLWHAAHLDDIGVVEGAMRDAAAAAGATLLRLDLHCFTPSGGITGVAVLAESHISIHTWPERAYAAVDVFMCGDADPHAAVRVLRRAFSPGMLTVSEHRRGLVP